MKVRFPENATIAEIEAEGVVIGTAQECLELLMDPSLEGARCIIVRREMIAPGFFDLRTGLAGDIAQKIVNYHFRLVIVGDVSDTSENFQAFMRESNSGKTLYFVSSTEEALKVLKA
jgi:Domain of unknown function (DUF4180)